MAESQENRGKIGKRLQCACYIPSRVDDSHSPFSSRSHLQPALKSRGFHDRMEKASKAQAIKKLQAELKEEKETEIQR
jgi:hypothetical protein